MKRYLLISSLGLIACTPAQASVQSDLYLQVKRELNGDPSSCWLMTPSYQSLFIGAAEWMGAGSSCGEGVEVMAELRRKNSGRHFGRQSRRELSAIRRADIISRGNHVATLSVRYRGTPPGWTFRPRSKTTEIYQMELIGDRWNTGSVEVKVRPPIARPTR